LLRAKTGYSGFFSAYQKIYLQHYVEPPQKVNEQAKDIEFIGFGAKKNRERWAQMQGRMRIFRKKFALA
jgi:hypothetical protein